MQLGKREYKHDKRTLMLGPLLKLDVIKVDEKYDFDRRRAPFPLEPWGNDKWGNCVIAGRANQMLRLERVERRVTLPLTERDVVEEYKNESEREFGERPSSPGDNFDQGLYVLEALKDWRNDGWDVPMNRQGTKRYRNYIEAYGVLDPLHIDQVKAAILLLRGVQFGFSLPVSAARQYSQERHWYVEQGAGNEPGSWGGHLVYGKRYDKRGVYVLTWGNEILVDWDFVGKYCDEAWAVVDRVDDSNVKHWLDVPVMLDHLQQIGAR